MAVISLLLFAATVLASPGHLKLDFSKKAVADPNLQARSAGSVDVPLTQSADKIVQKSSAYAGSLFLLTIFSVGILHQSHHWNASSIICTAA
jgi:hypothetical protein